MSKKEFKLSEYKLTHINVEVEMQDELKRKQRRFDYSLNLNIKAAYDMRLDMAGIDLIDLCIFEVIKSMMISDSFSKVIVEGVQWIWVAHSKVLDQCPFLEIKKQRLSQRIQKLCDVGLLKKHLDMASGSRTLYRQGPSFDGMLLAGGTEKITHPSVVSYAGGTEKITDNNIILNKSINNECKSDLGKSSPTTSSEESKTEEKEKPKQDTLPAEAEAAKSLWNDSFPPEIVRIRTMTRKRVLGLSRRVSEGMDLSKILNKAQYSDFLRGKNDRGWKMDFDWLISNDTNWVKVMEGKYDNKPSHNKRTADMAIYQ